MSAYSANRAKKQINILQTLKNKQNDDNMKRDYLKPTTLVVELRHKTCLLQSSVTRVSTNLTSGDAIIYNGQGSSVDARVKEGGDYNVWDDDWSE